MKKLTEELGVGDDRADLTPLIDCVFLLLLFFVVTAVFVEESNLFKIELEKAEHSEVRQLEDVVTVWISREGQYAMDQAYVPDDDLWPRLKSLHDKTPIKTLVIKGDKASPLGKMLVVMDMAKALGVTEILPAVEQKMMP